VATQVSVKLSDDVADVLRRSTINGASLLLPAGALPRPLYLATDKAITALGGKWDKRAKAHLFPFDPTEKLSAALSSGKALDEVLTRKKRLQLFETPSALAKDLVAMLEITDRDVCLEPSAGKGRIVAALADAGATHIIAVEIDGDNGSDLISQGLANDILVVDFLEQRPAVFRADAIAMNPPFTRNQDIKHVRHAYDCLAAGGRMSAIVSAHGFTGQEREAVEFRDWLGAVGADVSVIPAGAFKESGTAIETRRIFIRKGSIA
jgi:predicted RNA methylase